jgi:hypothetical protein
VPDPKRAWIDWGRYQAADFARCDDGAYVNTMAGSPMWIRCLRQDGSVVYVVDGQGDPYTYRLVAFPSHRYWETGQPRPEAEYEGLRFDDAGDPYVTWEDVERMTASLAPGETLLLPEDVRIQRAPDAG